MRSLRKRALSVCEAEKPKTNSWSMFQKYQGVIVLGMGLIGAAVLTLLAEFIRRHSPIVLYISIFLTISMALDRVIRSRYREWLRRAGLARPVLEEVDGGADYSGAVETNEQYFRSGAGG